MIAYGAAELANSFRTVRKNTVQVAEDIPEDKYGFSWWDCMLLASASLAGCEIFFSEDLQHEQTVAGLIVLSPFKLDPGFLFTR